MRNSLRAGTAGLAVAFLVFGGGAAARAEDHLPILDIQPGITWATAGDARGNPASPVADSVPDFSGSATLPLFPGVSFTYDHIAGGLFHGTFNSVNIGGTNIQPGSYNDHVEQYHLDATVKGFSIGVGLANRHRICCPAAADTAVSPGTEYHEGYLSLTYTTPSLELLNHGVFVLNVTGRTANHDPSPQILAGTPKGLDIGHVREYATNQSVTAVIPIDLKGGLVSTATYLWGGIDMFEDFPFPFYYKIFAFTLKKNFNPYVALEITNHELWQPEQGSPFPAPGNAIHVADLEAQLAFHIDLNKLFAPAKK